MDESILSPISKTAAVALPPLEAFELFTSHISLWWPLETFSVRKERAETCIFELWVGGDVFELAENSERILWGKVLEFDPPDQFLITWHPDRPEETAQTIQCTFRDSDTKGTELTLMQTGWDKLGDEGADARALYDRGWDDVLGRYLDLARSEAGAAR